MISASTSLSEPPLCRRSTISSCHSARATLCPETAPGGVGLARPALDVGGPHHLPDVALAREDVATTHKAALGRGDQPPAWNIFQPEAERGGVEDLAVEDVLADLVLLGSFLGGGLGLLGFVLERLDLPLGHGPTPLAARLLLRSLSMRGIRAGGGPVDKRACGKIADYVRKEIDRIVSVSEPWRP